MWCILCPGGGGAGGAGDAAKYKDFSTQYAKSGQSTCRGCENKIEKVRRQAVIVVFILIVIVTFSCRRALPVIAINYILCES